MSRRNKTRRKADLNAYCGESLSKFKFPFIFLFRGADRGWIGAFFVRACCKRNIKCPCRDSKIYVFAY